MSNTSRTNASDSDKMPTRKQIAALFSQWAKGNIVTRFRVCVELLGFPADSFGDKDQPAQLEEMVLVIEQMNKGKVDREMLQNFLRKPLPPFGEFKKEIPDRTEPATLRHEEY